jgi:RNA polymerase sigma-70 factor (ECF subfamily)
MAGNEDLARDILQEVLLTVVRRVRHLKEPESFWQWVVTIARNKMRDYYRRNYARSQAENEFRLRFQNKIKQQGGYEAKRERREALQDIYVLAQKLDRMYSQIIELRCLEGRSYSEIAEITGISSRNSCVRLHRARQILCEKLDKRAGECF